MALTQTQVSQLYISIFGRASEGAGNTYWQATADMATAANTMLATDAAATYFGTSLSTDQAFVEHIYLNTLGKTYAQDTAGVDGWVAYLATHTRGEMVAALVYAAQQPANAGAAQDMFNNKVTVSNYCADNIETADVADLSAFTGYISSVTDSDATVTAANAAIDADVTPGTTFAFTANNDTVFGTAGHDVFTATDSTYSSNDVLADGSTADNDTFTVTVATDNTDLSLTGTIVGIENINVNVQEFTNASFALDVAGVAAGTVNVDVTQAGSAINTITLANLSSIAVALSSDFATVVIDADADADVVLSTAKTTAVTIDDTGAAGNLDTLTVTSAGDVTVTIDTVAVSETLTVTSAGSATIDVTDAVTVNVTATDEVVLTDINSATTATISATGTAAANNITTAAALTTLNLSGNGAALAMDIQAAGATALTTVNFTGTQNVELVISGDDYDTAALDVNDETTAGTTRVNFSAASNVGTINMSAIAADEIELSADFDSEVITVATGAKVLITADQDNAGGGTTVKAALATASTNTVTVEITDDDATTTGSTRAVRDLDDSVFQNFATINLVLTDDLHIETSVNAAANLTATGADIVITGAGALSNITTGVITADSINASAMTGAASLFLSGATGTVSTGSVADTLTVEGASSAGFTLSTGAGNDTINLGITADDYTINGGDGTDTVSFTATTDLTGKTFDLTNVEVLDLDLSGDAASTITIDSDQISGKTLIVTASETTTDDILDITIVAATADFSNLTVNDSNVDVTIDANAYTLVTGVTVTGTNANDTITINGGKASTANGGAGADTITGGAEGDTINGGAGVDTIIGAAGADTLTGGEGADVITGGAGADSINLAETVAALDTVILAAGDSTEAAMDKVSGFTTHASTGDVLNINTTTAAASIGATDVSGVTSEASDVVTASTSATGIMTLAGANAANIDTLAEWIDAAEVLLTTLVSANSTANVLGVLAFEFNGNTYVVEGSDTAGNAYTTSVVVELTGVTGITGLSTTAAANVIDIA